MTTIEIWSDTKGRARCKGCQARIEWAEVVKSGRRMPFTGSIVALSTRRDERSARVIEIVDLQTNHWASCPGAKLFKRARS